MAELSLPSNVQVPYAPPDLPNLLSLAGYLYLLSSSSSLADAIINAPLLGPLLIGILLGPSLAGLLPPATQQVFIDLGYIGLILIVFEAGLTTDLPLLIGNAGLSFAAALTGILLPIALSMALFKGAWGYTGQQAFAAGAALCSTSLGTTLALLTPNLRKTRVGSVLMCAALLDDVVGLVIAGIIPGLAEAESGVDWVTIVRPVLVSIAFGLGTPCLAWFIRKLLQFDWTRIPTPLRIATNKVRLWRRNTGSPLLYDSRTQLLVIILTLSAFVAGTKYAGTSELFGAYLASALLAYIFSGPNRCYLSASKSSAATSTPTNLSSPSISASPRNFGTPPTPEYTVSESLNPSMDAFTTYLQPILTPFLGPIFFASIGSALPVGALFTTYPNSTLNGADVNRGPASHRVVWRGVVYALLMILAKMAVGLWILVWPEPGRRHEISAMLWWWEHQQQDPRGSKSQARGDNPSEPTRTRAAALLGLAMVARGEIALIVAQLARPLLLGASSTIQVGTTDEEPFAIVIWAILVSTVGGALGVGLLLGSWRRKDEKLS
ncbi:hypothetical protein GALMADRAFT_58453 [Galerina marginata CBS 339.88]|uniref:Cation/H+ exchanger transmembrane domain-containing protein n=1 Tax=Galerina marginata (strain CBS 339.88) TaxID=685588 RepID=A0A067THR1_GALM3|nr:hypothetical protein GALMADRAFT_58453 [Galerina marginata CBS 339.88]